MESNITITPKAVLELKKLNVSDGRSLRISVVPGGCSGMTYTAAIDDKTTAEDLVVYQDQGLRIVCDPGSAVFLDGLHIDFSDDLIRSGFRFTNPNASGSCGCGASFGA